MRKLTLLISSLAVATVATLGVAAPATASAQAAAPITCTTHASYSKAKNVTTVWVKVYPASARTSRKIFDYRLQYEDANGNNTALWVKNKGMKIAKKGKFFGGYAYRGTKQCGVFGEGIG